MSLITRIACAAVLVGAIAGCSAEQGGHTPAAQSVNVAVDPPAAEVQPGGNARFAATVTGTADTGVVWAVAEAGGGAVDTTGLYTAPAGGGVFHVRATSHADPAVSAQATVTVVAPVTVTVSPKTPSVAAGGRITFTAVVANATNTAVVWSVPAAGCGTITSAGVYTAPAAAATCSVVATSQADPSRSDSATVTVTAPPVPVAVSVTPASPAANTCASVTFTATVTGTSNTSVTWSVQEGAIGGAVTTAGVYTAPSNAGTYHVVATSNADPTRSAVATVTVTDRVLSVAVSPQTVQVPAGGTAQFTATVTTTCGTSTSTKIIDSTGKIVAN